MKVLLIVTMAQKVYLSFDSSATGSSSTFAESLPAENVTPLALPTVKFKTSLSLSLKHWEPLLIITYITCKIIYFWSHRSYLISEDNNRNYLSISKRGTPCSAQARIVKHSLLTHDGMHLVEGVNNPEWSLVWWVQIFVIHWLNPQVLLILYCDMVGGWKMLYHMFIFLLLVWRMTIRELLHVFEATQMYGLICCWSADSMTCLPLQN